MFYYVEIVNFDLLTPEIGTCLMFFKQNLERELGLIRKRTVSSSSLSRRGLSNGSSAQTFKYLIVIDFESTCWKDAKFRTQEIIEFPAVLLNTLSGEVESEFHHYVQPQEQPTLSAFCTELTGITQSQVDEGIPINLCLRKFGHWLDRLYREKGVVCQGTITDTNAPVNTTCVTWSDWDLGVCLQYECKRKQLLKPPQLTSWIDLRATYRKFYDRKPNGLNGALQDLGIEFQGREHSGVDDARNTAKLAFRMIKDGCQMKVTKTLKTHERSVSCNPTMLQYVSKATRTTPPRKAKEKSNTATISSNSPKESLKSTSNTNKKPKDSPCKIPVRTKTPEKSGMKKQGSVQNSSICQCYNINFDCGSDKSQQNVNSFDNKKRKQFTPVKDMSTHNTNLPKRKISRKFSPKKFTSDNIFVDHDESNDMQENSNGKVKPTEVKNGLSIQDTNIPVKNTDKDHCYTGNFQKDSVKVDAGYFKLPNPVGKPCAQSTFKTPQSFIKPNALNGSSYSKSRSFVTSTPVGGTNIKCGFNQSKIISPFTNQSSTLTGRSDCATPSTFSSSSSNTNKNSKDSPSKIPVRTKTPEKSGMKKQGSVQNSLICQCYNLNFDCGSDKSQQNVNSIESNKRKQVTPVKDMSKNSTYSPRRKISRKLSPKKFTSADIFVDPDESSDIQVNSTGIVKPMEVKKGLSTQDTNIQIDKTDKYNNTGNFKKDLVKGDAECFKLPNPVNKSSAQSTFKTPQLFIKPNALNGSSCSKSRSFVTSTPVGGTNNKSGFNQSKIISPFTNQSATLTGRSDCATPGTFSSSRTGFRTPCQTPSFDGSEHQSGFSINSSNMKMTPPLCKCGRRSKRRMVQSPGQNMGRFFFSCSIRKSVGSKEGCDFFKWETTGMTHNNSVISKQFTPVVRGNLQQVSGVKQKKSLGVRSVPPQKVYLR